MDKDLNGELRAEGAAGHHLIECLGETHADCGPPVELEGGHGRRLQAHTSKGIINYLLPLSSLRKRRSCSVPLSVRTNASGGLVREKKKEI